MREHKGIGSTAEQEGSEGATDAPGIENGGIDRTEGHGVEVVELVSSGLCSCELQ